MHLFNQAIVVSLATTNNGISIDKVNTNVSPSAYLGQTRPPEVHKLPFNFYSELPFTYPNKGMKNVGWVDFMLFSSQFSFPPVFLENCSDKISVNCPFIRYHLSLIVFVCSFILYSFLCFDRVQEIRQKKEKEKKNNTNDKSFLSLSNKSFCFTTRFRVVLSFYKCAVLSLFFVFHCVCRLYLNIRAA